MWCPSVSLSLWANAWFAGMAAPDDVLDALSLWAPKQSVTAYDAVAAGHTGLPWPDVPDARPGLLLRTLPAPGRRPRRAVSARRRPGLVAADTACRGWPAEAAGFRRRPRSVARDDQRGVTGSRRRPRTGP